jgi:hypothetical protein
MARASELSAAQQAALIACRREGRPDIAAMTNEERRAAGLMDLGQAAEHEHLRSLPVTRVAERVRGPVPDDIWAGPDPAEADALEAWRRVFESGHLDCDGWSVDGSGPLVCACGAVIGETGAAS